MTPLRKTRRFATDLASIARETGEMQRLFHPRRDQWREHYELRGGEIVARTAIGRVSVEDRDGPRA